LTLDTRCIGGRTGGFGETGEEEVTKERDGLDVSWTRLKKKKFGDSSELGVGICRAGGTGDRPLLLDGAELGGCIMLMLLLMLRLMLEELLLKVEACDAEAAPGESGAAKGCEPDRLCGLLPRPLNMLSKVVLVVVMMMMQQWRR
jgi:hypothetical protein